MSSTLPNSTRKKILKLRADRAQKEIDLLKIQEDLAALDDTNLSTDSDSGPFSAISASSSMSSLVRNCMLDESEMISDKMAAATVAKKIADEKMQFYAADFRSAQASIGPKRDSWMAASKKKYDKHYNLFTSEASIIADCAKRLASLTVPTVIPPPLPDQSFFSSIEPNPIIDGHSG